jgi:GPH family glycoside/pentoside/hexuronide:cation symporter
VTEAARARGSSAQPQALPAPAPVPEASIPLRTLFAYCAPALGAGFMFLLVGLYLMKFSTDVLLISPAAIGLIFGSARLWDAFADPTAGYLSDRTRSRLGRRRSWMLWSIVPIAATYLMAWSPPATLGGGVLLGWMTVAIFGFYTATTVLLIPHLGLGAELTQSYHERTRLFGFRHVFWSVGSFIALPAMSLFTSGKLEPRGAAFALAVAAAIAMALLILYSVAGLREREDYQGRGGENPWRAYRDVLRNPHARLLMIVYLIENLGSATIGILTPYIGEYIVGRKELTPVFIAFYFVPTIASVPLWIPLSRRFGKKNLWIFAMLLTGFSFGGMFFLEEGSVVLISVLAVLAGTAGGCGAVVGPSVLADCVDYDEHATGERKEGAYFAAWNVVFKAASGLTAMFTGIALQLSGFTPNAAQSDTTKLALLTLYAIFPLVAFLIGTALFLRFGFGEREHAQIRLELDERAARAEVNR